MRKLYLRPVQFDIALKNGDVVATVTRTGKGWAFRDLKTNWFEHVEGTIPVDSLVEVFMKLRREKRKEATASSTPPDLSEGRPPGEGS